MVLGNIYPFSAKKQRNLSIKALKSCFERSKRTQQTYYRLQEETLHILLTAKNLPSFAVC